MKDLIADGVAAIVKFVFVWLIWGFVLLNLGRITLLLCTLGRYPRGRTTERDTNRIAFIGLVVLIFCGRALRSTTISGLPNIRIS